MNLLDNIYFVSVPVLVGAMTAMEDITKEEIVYLRRIRNAKVTHVWLSSSSMNVFQRVAYLKTISANSLYFEFQSHENDTRLL